MKSITQAVLATSLLGCIPSQAGSEASAVAESSSSSSATGLLVGKLSGDSAWDRTWSAFTLYKDENNPILQEFALQGRLQVQAAYGDSSTQNYHDAGKGEFFGEDFEIRRARFGFKSKWFQTWKLEGQIDVDADYEDRLGDETLYKDIYDLYLTYAPSDAFNMSVGKTKVKFSREQEISSKEILTFERSLVSNMLFPGELTGVWVNGKGIQEHWLYELGLYGADRVREFSNFDQGAVVLGKIGYDYSSQVGLDSAVASFHYMHNTNPAFKELQSSDEAFSFSTSPSFTDSIALTNDLTQGRFGLTTEIMYGFGYDGDAEQNGKTKAINQSDVFGLTIIPSYFIADGLQLVGRIQYATSADDNGLTLPGRYEEYSAKTTDVKGDAYLSGYLGLNYYLYGHKLKVMSGVEYSSLSGGDYDGYTFLTGARMCF